MGNLLSSPSLVYIPAFANIVSIRTYPVVPTDHQGSSMLETIFLFLIVSSTVESQREVRCARGWVRYGGGYTRDNWRIDGGCFTPAVRFNQ